MKRIPYLSLPVLGDVPHEFDNRGVNVDVHGDDLLDVVHVEVLVAGVVVKVVRQLLAVGGLLVNCWLDILVLIEVLL